MKKYVQRIAAAMLTLALCAVSLTPAVLADDDSVSISSSSSSTVSSSAPESAPKKIEVPVQVDLTGTLPDTAESFEIVLNPASGEETNPMPAGSENGAYTLIVNGDGSTSLTANFPEIEFTRVGIYHYTITQTPGSNPDCYYDPAVYALTVYVTNADNGGLEKSFTLYKDNSTVKTDKALFTNDYADPDIVTIQAIKTLDGKTPRDGRFSFYLTDEEQKEILQEVTNAGQDVIFDEIVFDKIGEYIYYLYEKDENRSDIIYDTSIYKIIVSVSKAEDDIENGKAGDYAADVSFEKDGRSYQGTPVFRNYTEEEEDDDDSSSSSSSSSKKPVVKDEKDPPNTGDDNNLALWLILMVVCVVLILCVVFFGRKRKNNH